MRQSVQALAVVTFDAPAETDVHHLWDDIADALIHGTHASVEPTAVELRAVREEAAMFNSNGDQWEADPEKPWDLRKGGEHILSVSVPFDHIARTSPMKPAVAAGMVAEALNFMAGRPARDETASCLYEACTVALDTLTRLFACGEDWDAVIALRKAIAVADKAAARVSVSAATPVRDNAERDPSAVNAPATPTGPRCAHCGNDGTQAALFLTIDARWQPAQGGWELQERDDTGGRSFDCLACDERTEVEGDASFFPYMTVVPGTGAAPAVESGEVIL